MNRHRAVAGAVVALGFLAVGCAGSKPQVRPAPSPVAEAPPPAPAEPPAPAAAPSQAAPSLDPIHFDFDNAEIHDEDTPTLQSIADYLVKDVVPLLTISGYCDERGTVEYNIALGDRRANVAREYLVRLGVDAARIRTISYGSAKPVDDGHDEAAWAKNRRDEFQIEHKQRAQAQP